MLKKLLIILVATVIIGCNIGNSESTPKASKQIESKNNKFKKEDSIDLIVQKQIKEVNPPKNVEIYNGEKLAPFEFTKGIYLSAYSVITSRFTTILDSAQAAGINTVIFDLKNMNGEVFFSVPQKDDLRGDRYRRIVNITKVVKALHERDMRAVSRVVMFHDQYLAGADSTLRIQKTDGTAWKESQRRKPSWLDSSNPEVQKDLLYLIEQAARGGVDEVQLDYVRFPTGGKLSDASFHFMREDFERAKLDSNYASRTKPDIIKDFIRRAQEVCDKYGTTLAADIFAIVAWQHKTDVANTGQNIEMVTEHLDMIHPMIYSSHFADNFGFREDVHNEPYYIMYKGTKLTSKYSNTKCRVVPYIQSNSWKVNYDADYIYAQIEAIKEAGGDGYILWNASNKYMKTLSWIKEFR